jgi:hypothetical protein
MLGIELNNVSYVYTNTQAGIYDINFGSRQV